MGCLVGATGAIIYRIVGFAVVDATGTAVRVTGGKGGPVVAADICVVRTARRLLGACVRSCQALSFG